MNSTDKKQVLIIGGGFAGLNVAKALGNKNQVEVTIVDRRNYHLFQPLLYQVATAGLSPADIATPIRDVLSKYPNVNVALDEITGFDAKNRIAKSKTREYKFDYAVVACGSSHSYFGKDDWEDAAPGLKTLEQATEIRRRILTAFEKAEIATDENLKTAALTFVVIGGGPTGVELSGSIAELARGTLNRDFRHFDPRSAKIILIEGGSRLVSAFPEELSANALKSLQDLGVQVRLGTRVTGVSDKGVNVGDEFIPCHTILWAAGVATNPIARILPGEKDQSGRVVISIDLSIPSYRNIFVLGDMAHFDLRMGKTLPGLAPVALQQGRHAA
ncbi:MAG: NAD(P)/FAD-dependent oxidoreductase, partial [Bdellovibrionota bacterium]